MILTPTRPETPWSTLIDLPRCPRCTQAFFGIEAFARSFSLTLSCRKKGCPQVWWTLALAAGDVPSQIGREIGYEEAPLLVVEYGLPTILRDAMFWQIALDSHQEYHRKRSIERARVLGREAPRFPIAIPSSPRSAA